MSDNSKRLKDHFDSVEQFEATFEEAQSNAESDYAKEFIDNLDTKVRRYGLETFVSDAQYEFLLKLEEGKG